MKLSIIIAFALVACGGSSDGKYNVLPKGEIHSEMTKLMELTSELDLIMRGTKSSEISQPKVVDLLTRIEASAGRLAKQGPRDEHQLLRDNIDAFLRTTTEARAAAAATPPNYYFAGTVGGTCVLCHDPRGGIQ